MAALTTDEEAVVKHKHTEPPYSGEYWDFYEDGIFVCRQCGLPLFDAEAKFDAQCGWPSFDDAFPYAVKELLDADGERTEILCARCGGHLGHVFRGEKLTNKDTRHCANSLSIKFVPRAQQNAYLADPKNQLAISSIVLGGGCFWCIEAAMMRIPGVLAAESGYSGGKMQNPTYEAVCSGATGHAEVVKITYDEQTLTLEQLLDYFFGIHDPTTRNAQGHDIGTQYRSVIFYDSEEHKKQIEAFIAKKQPEYKSEIVTEVAELQNFYRAEEYHQRYFEKNPYAAYCQVVVMPKVNKVETIVRKDATK